LHVAAFTVLSDDRGRTSFQATNQATTEIEKPVAMIAGGAA
jgi:hypothetical protein